MAEIVRFPTPEPPVEVRVAAAFRAGFIAGRRSIAGLLTEAWTLVSILTLFIGFFIGVLAS